MIFLIGAIPVIIVTILVYMSRQAEIDEFERREEKSSRRMHVEHIRKTYPKAFSKYWEKPDLANSVFKEYSNVILNENSVNWTDYQWRILENDLEKKSKENIQKKELLIYQIDEIRKSFPNGLREYLIRNPKSADEDSVSTAEKIVNNRVQIELFEKEFSNSQEKNVLSEKVPVSSETTKKTDPYVIISIVPFFKVLEFDKTILVKSNKVVPSIVNNNIIGYNYSKEDNENTRWMIFNSTGQNLQILQQAAKECEQGNFWIPDKMKFRSTWVDYFDMDKKKDVGHRVEVEITGLATNMTQREVE